MPNAKARSLRKNMTDAERRLWTVLRYWNTEILRNASGVAEAISHALAKFK